MATNVTEFESQIADILNRGSTLDSVIPIYIGMAVRRIERAHTFKYMEKLTSGNLDSSAASPEQLSLPADFKVWTNEGFLRLDKDNGEEDIPSWVYMKQVEPYRIDFEEGELPQGFWVEGMSTIHFDAEPDKDYPYEIYYAAYTAWPSSGTHWLIDNAEDWLTAETMIMMSPYIREDQDMMIRQWRMIRRDSMANVIETDEELRTSLEDNRMKYPNTIEGGG